MVEKIGGSIQVQSKEKEFTEVILNLPFSKGKRLKKKIRNKVLSLPLKSYFFNILSKKGNLKCYILFLIFNFLI